MLTMKSIKLTDSPSKNPHTGDLTGYATVESLACETFSLDPNLRNAELGPIQRRLMADLKADPARFSLHNQGILFTARAATYDEASGTLEMAMAGGAHGDRNVYDDGIADGGHTWKSLCQAYRELVEASDDEALSAQHRAVARQQLRAVREYGVVRVEVLVKMGEDELPQVCEDRNISKKQKRVSLVNHRDGFAMLKQVLGPDLVQEVAFFEGDTRPDDSEKPYKVQDIVRLIYATVGRGPQMSYSSIDQVIRSYEERMSAGDPDFIRATQEAVKMMNLYSTIYQQADLHVLRHTKLQKVDPQGKAAYGITAAHKGQAIPFKKSEHPRFNIPHCFILPIFGAVAQTYFNREGNRVWEKDPSQAFNSHKKALFEKVFSIFEKEKTSTTSFGKEPHVWESLENVVLKAL